MHSHEPESLAILVLESADGAEERQATAVGWLAAHPRDASVLVIAPSLEAGSRVVRAAAEGQPAVFGWERTTLVGLAARLSIAPLARKERVTVTRLALEAVCARVVHRLRDEKALGRFASVGDRPGLAHALARTFSELSLAGLLPSALDGDPTRGDPPVDRDTGLRFAPLGDRDLGALFAAYRRELDDAGLADRSDVLRAAIARIDEPAPHPLLDIPIVMLDVPVPSALDAQLIAALARRAPAMRAVIPSGDRSAARRLAPILGEETTAPSTDRSRALARVKAQLFSAIDCAAPIDPSVELFSAPGESRECVEIARRVLRAAGEGVPFDRMAVLTHAPDRYRAHLVEALRRAGVPAYFSRGTVRPDPAGRALLALLSCKEEGLSARAFGEYLSVGVVPHVDEEGTPIVREPEWLPPDDDLLFLPEQERENAEEGNDRPGGALRAPWRWERLIVDAAVIGAERWRRRLFGLDRSLAMQIDALEDPDDPLRAGLERRRRDLGHLSAFALPLLGELDALPSRASWGEWAERLAALAAHAIRDPARVLSVLRELAPMGPIGPVGLTEVAIVLARRLAEMVSPPSGSPATKLYVASIEEARGLSFDVVFVPGLAEKVFPKKLIEDPIALDGMRATLSGELATLATRVEQERLALRLAVGAACQRVVLSYPRLDTERGRPRVPSFYALEVLRAIEGKLPSFPELSARAEEAGAARMAWPAPEHPEDAIDGAEYDLAVLHRVLYRSRLEEARGAARYLMSANTHLARALRTRFLRWDEKWSRADGMVNPVEEAKPLLAAHHPDARAYSATALEQLAACPYRFYLRSIVKLEPREPPAAIEELEPRERGSLMHEAQAAVLGALREQGLLPLKEEDRGRAREVLNGVLDEAAERYAERLAPAIDRVWRDALDDLRSDLLQWLARMSDAFVPTAFELSFGMEKKGDPASRGEPVRLGAEGLTLRGAIDLVEERDGALRATDHKSGTANASPSTIAGGRVLQPLLYARVLEELFPGRRVLGGRLYYCTARGGFEERFVPLNEVGRDSVRLLADTLRHHVDEAFFPAAPSEGECAHCDYRAVCGPAEERRVRRKQRARLGALRMLRKRP